MPHKHTRREHDESSFNLPPTQIARPLPVNLRSQKALRDAKGGKGGKGGKNANNPKTENDGVTKNRKKRGKENDAPRAFRRIMALSQGKKQRSGLDNGETISKKKAKAAKKAEENKELVEVDEKPEMPTIRPGEKMSEFASRVNAALPLAGLVNKTARDGKDPLGLKVYKTRKERKMHKLYDQWREEERKIQEQKEEELEEAAERELDEEISGGTFGNFGMTKSAFEEPGSKKKKKGKKGKGAEREEDPWAVLKKMRAETKPGLHDVVQAPPELHKANRGKLLVRGAAVDVSNVPKSAGSLRRREELQGIRDELVSSYRKKRQEKLARVSASTSRDTLDL